jgi:hypothetical protein
MEPKALLQHSKEPAVRPCQETNDPSPLWLGLQNGLFLSDFAAKFVYVLYFLDTEENMQLITMFP